MERENRLPAELEERIRQGEKNGITLSFNWKDDSLTPRSGKITSLHWTPGDPNALAAAIIKHVGDEPVPLVLNKELFLIQRAHGKLEENELGGVTFNPA